MPNTAAVQAAPARGGNGLYVSRRTCNAHDIANPGLQPPCYDIYQEGSGSQWPFVYWTVGSGKRHDAAAHCAVLRPDCRTCWPMLNVFGPSGLRRDPQLRACHPEPAMPARRSRLVSDQFATALRAHAEVFSVRVNTYWTFMTDAIGRGQVRNH